VHRILGAATGMNRLPAVRSIDPTPKRCSAMKAQPGHRLQMDVKFILERISRDVEAALSVPPPSTIARVRVLKVYDACNQATAIRFVDEVLRRLPFRVHVVADGQRRGVPVTL
jgi:hypothetical protein